MMGGPVITQPRLRLVSSDEPWMSKQQLAAALGFSVRWVEYRLAEGLPHRRIGGRVRFQRSVAEAWLQDREQGSSAA
jgi:hypothetical protein